MPNNDLPGTLDTQHGPPLANASPQSTTAPEPSASAETAPALDLRGYELLERLGGGGMGDVYRAGDPALGRDLAVKVMKADYQGNPSAERRFLREARVTGSLQHPGIVPIYNLGRLADGRLHYTMRLVRGRTLADILKEEAGQPERLPALLTIFEKVCQAVAYAHSKRVLHRDLKPANVMVGRFGEVQVMDWGLAKLLTPGERGCASAPSEEDEGGTRIHTEAADTPLAQTRMGREMGTPAYMPPEQALGEWDTVDERADVFALGAILCEILTGRPPYSSADSEESLRKAKRGDCAEALARLANCSADAELVGLCRECLTPAREHRPQDAEQVAQRVAAYQAEVQARLHRAELERARALVKAAEERKRRRLTVVLAAAVLLAILVGGGALVMAQRQKQARQEQTARLVQQALGQATALRDQAQAALLQDSALRERAAALWRDTLAAADRAEQALVGGEADADTSRQAAELLNELRRQAAEANKDRRMLERLEEAHNLEMEIQESDYARKRRVEEFVFGLAAVPAYAAAFREYGIDVEALSTNEAVERIRSSAIRFQLAAALDDWYFLAPDAAGGRLLDISQGADPDPLRGRVRAAVARKDRQALEQLADSKEVIELPVPTLILLADVLHEQGLLSEGVRLLKRARSRYPNDFWVNDVLGLHLRAADPPDYGEAARCFAAAIALRPSSPVGWGNLGIALAILGRLDDAVRVLGEGIRIKPDFLLNYQLIADVLIEKSELDQALAVLQEPLRRHPHSPMLCTTLGRILQFQGKMDEAITVFRQVLARNPEWVNARIYLASALSQSGLEREALELLDQAQRSHPELCMIYEARGWILKEKGDIEGALAAYRKAAELGPGIVGLWSSLAGVLVLKGRHNEALQMHRKAIHLTPESAAQHVSLADSLRLMGRTNEAESEYHLAMQLNPRSALAHNGLGLLLLVKRQNKDAEQAFRQALSLRPKDPWIHAYVGLSLRSQKDYRAAEAAIGEAIRLKPEEGVFHDYLGHIFYDQACFAEAISHYREAIRRKEAKLGANHPDALLSMAHLGVAYRDAGQFKDAIPLLETVLERGRQRPGGLPSSLTGVSDALAQTYERDGQFAKAETVYRDSLTHVRRQFGPDDPRTARVLAQLGDNLLKQKKFRDAESLLRRCLKVREAKQPDEWNTFNARSMLGEALAGQKKYAEAEPLLLQGYQGIEQRQDKIASTYRQLRLREALERLVRLYEDTGQKEKADDWRKKLHETKSAEKKSKS
jgi:serine/threonine protein kinase/predicted Zn-dependent protease